MANRGASNGGYRPDKPPPYRNAQSELEIDVWDPTAASSSYSNSPQQATNSIPQWQNTSAGGYQQHVDNPHLYSQGDMNSNWRSSPTLNAATVPQPMPYYDPGPQNANNPQSGYTGQMMTPVSNTFPQYQMSGTADIRQTIQSYAPSPPPHNIVQQPPIGNIPVAQNQAPANMGPVNMPVAQHQLPPNMGQVGLYGTSQTGNWSSAPQVPRTNTPPPSSFSNPLTFTNPLMDNTSDDVSDAASLIRNMHIEGQKAKQQMQNVVRYPTVLSKASLAVLKKDLEQAAVVFESPEALKLARERELGLHVVEDMGKPVIVSTLSVNAADFIPRSKSPVQEHVPTQAPKEEEVALLADLKSLIENVLKQPGSFDELSAVLINRVKYFLHSDDAVKEMVEVVFTKAINEDNFKYLGARLCDKLTMPDILTNFRTLFLNHFQKEFKAMQSLVADRQEKDRAKIHGFFMFMAEIFIHIKVNGKPLISFGRSLNKALAIILEDPTSANVAFVCKILKLAGAKLLDAFEGNEGDTENYQKTFAILNEQAEKHKEETDADSKRIVVLISSVSRLKDSNWGRTMSNTRPKSSIEDPEQYGDELSELDQNYYMNEPVFFTPEGVQYTAAEAQIPEFYDQHLAKYNLRPDIPQDQSSSFAWSQNDEAFDDYALSDEEEEFYKLQSQEEEYTNEFEKFLAESGQLE